MGLSFEESMKKMMTKNMVATTNANDNIAVAAAPASPIMTLEEPTVYYDGLAYSGEDWTEDKEHYRWFNEYIDEKYSYIDDKKNISLNEDQINITQETNSQFIPFEMPRYFDGIDLVAFKLSVHFTRSDRQHASSEPVNVKYNNHVIRFAWLVDDNVTGISGDVSFEVHATGVILDSNGNKYPYEWKAISDKTLNVLQSLCGIDCGGHININESWVTELVQKTAASVAETIAKADVGTQVAKAEAAADKAEMYANNAEKTAVSVVNNRLSGYYTKSETELYVGEQIANADIEGKLTEYAKTSDLEPYALKTDIPENVSTFINDVGYLTAQSLEGYATEQFVESAISAADITDKLHDYVLSSVLDERLGELVDSEGNPLTVKEYVDAVDVSSQLAEYAKSADVYNKTETYTKTEVDNAIKNVKVDLTGYATEEYVGEQISPVNTAIATINTTLEGIDKSPNARYYTTYNEPYSIEGTEYTGENTLAVYEVFNKDTENETSTVVSAHVITGGSGGSSSANTIKIERITNSPLVVTTKDKVIIEYMFTGTDSSGDDIGQGNVTWKLGNRVIKTETVYTGENFADLTEHMAVASDQKVTLIITDDVGSMQQKTWYISVVDVKLESAFDDTRTYQAGSPVSFTFTPYGSVDKTIHFLLDGEEVATKTSGKSAAGLSDSYSISAQEHGAHLFEIYATATVNNNDIESNHIVKDIIWYDENSDIPVIGCVNQKFTARQYETTNITYTVYDPSTETPNVTLRATYVNEDGEIVETYNSSLVLTSNTGVWAFKTDVIGEHTLTITCGETVKTLVATIEDIGIEVSPTTAGLEFDFNPVGYSNNDANRIWSDNNSGVNMTVSDNFDWTNGGYQMDDAGDQYFCVKAGTTATINYNLFADDAKDNGKEFKVIFKTTNVKNRNTSFISCMDSGIGLDMKVESANIYSSNGSLYSPYCEDDIIEFEFNINKNTDIPMVLTYEDGVGNRPMIYTSDSSFWQTNPTPIVIGSSNCDVHIYRMKAYSTSLSDKDILNNFIADARSAEEMIARYKRNQIYKEGALNPEYLAEVCPDLRIILVDAPWFTNDKDNKVTDTTITMIYKNGDPVLDNWTCTGATHRGQGTSSNEYGYSGRNIDLVMDTDTSLFTLGDGVTTASTITLTRDSVPTDYLNVKVNIASSENQNNAQMARNYSLFNPFIRFARWKDSKVKDCMEFFNCVVFVRERNEDISTHREFQDTDFHFYAIGNVGDSKKTDDTRMNDKNDPKEHIVEITDYNVPLAEFPTGTEGICPEEEWKAGNKAYDFLYADYEYEDGKFKSFGAGSYEFRYEMKKITEEQRQVNIDTWREMYKFVITSSDEDFYAKLKEWFVIDSILYYYLFTERYTMVDNRAKNSFWHYGKVYISETEAESLGENVGGYIIDNAQAAIRNGYRYDLSQGYDFDTSLGIDNTGKLVLTYGKEDVDYYVDGDSTSGYIYRAAESTFFCRIRDLFASEMQAMFVDRENQNAWSSSRLIKQWDDAQAQFPEELWRLDIQRKYFRTYQGISIDNSFAGEANPRFLTEMLNGRKKYQRRMFERNQELYMATKYFGRTATQDQIMMRFNNPVGAAISPDFTLYITPYSDMYIGTSFGNVTPTNFRAKAGVEYTIPCSIESGTADITLVYGASFIQAIGDLSRCYVGDNDFSKASRLQSLTIGSDVTGYSNSFMTKISLGNNKLLEYLDIRNVTGLNSVVDLSNCNNLIELYAENSGATGVIFANGGKVEEVYIPAVTSLTIKNLNYLKEFVIQDYDKLQTLVVENTPFLNTYEMVNNSSVLKVLRLIGIDWSLENNAILERILTLRGMNNTNGEIATSVLSGYTSIPVIKEYDYYKYKEQWSDLEINAGTTIKQVPVYFKNYDGEIIDTQYVDEGHLPVDPVTRTENPIATPVKESDAQYNYTYIGWDKQFTNVALGGTYIYTAQFDATVRTYTVTYVQPPEFNITEPLQKLSGKYGSYAEYTNSTPIYTKPEDSGAFTFYLFSGWDKTGYVDGDKIITARYDTCSYTEGYFRNLELNDMRPVEIYMLTRLISKGVLSLSMNSDGSEITGISGTNINPMDAFNFTMGYDLEVDSVESEVIIEDTREFSGTVGDYYDTGISLFDTDRSFVFAVDYEFGSGNKNGAVLMQCFDNANSDGFALHYTTNPEVKWYNYSSSCATGSNREMLVIRHKAGETGAHIYISNLTGTEIGYIDCSEIGIRIPSTDATLVFGCRKRLIGEVYERDFFAKGKIHWAKIWYDDLGDATCRSLASYIHEKIETNLCGFRRYNLAGSATSMPIFSFMASKTLYNTRKMNYSSTNIGGWAMTELSNWLNTRFYKGLPSSISQLIKKVTINSLPSGAATVNDPLISSDQYIYIPALADVSSTAPNVYKNEILPGSLISYITDSSLDGTSESQDRIRCDHNGNAINYWLRSPSDASSNKTSYFYYVNNYGSTSPVLSLSTLCGVVIMFSI